MLKKLLKVEWMSSGRTLAILDLGVFGINVLAALMMVVAAFFPVLGSQTWYSVIIGSFMFFAVIGLLIMMAGTVFINIRSFYNLLGQRGYLMLTLPVTINQHIFAKLLYAILSTLVAIAFLIVDTSILAAGSGENILASFTRSNGGFEFTAIGSLLYFIVLAVLMLAAGYLFCYLCVAIGGQWAQQRLLASIVSYFVLQFVMQIVFFIVVLVLAFPVAGAIHSGQSLYGINSIILYGGGSVVLLSVALNAILWVATRYLMTKKLNLA